VLGKPLFEMPRQAPTLSADGHADYVRRMQADDGRLWWEKLIEPPTE
jgi:hypothetical protein